MKLQAALNLVLHTIAAFSLLATATSVNHIERSSDSRVWTVGQPVRTTSGLVVGHAAAGISQVSEYVGIPYAVPPLGRLRFQPPVRYTGNGTVNATSFVSSIVAYPHPRQSTGVRCLPQSGVTKTSSSIAC